MIVVVGLPAYADAPDGERCAGGLAVEVAAAAVRRGGTVELVGKIGSDGTGDAVVVALGRMGVGHAALVRDPVLPTPVLAPEPIDDDAGAPETVAAAASGAEPAAGTVGPRLLPDDAASRPGLEAADVDLALEFLPPATVVVLAGPLPDSAITAAASGASFTGARLIVIVPPGTLIPQLPAEATVLEMPPDDDGSFGRMAGTYAGALEAGLAPADAFREAVSASGWEPVAD